MVEQKANGRAWMIATATLSTLRRRQDRLPRLLAARFLPPRSISREIWTRDQPSRPHGALLLRLPLAGRGAVEEGQIGLWRLSAGP